MSRAVSATQRTLTAIRKADRLPRDITTRKSNRRGISTSGRGSGGSSIYWAQITAVTSNEMYVADIYFNRFDTVSETGQNVKVWDIVDPLVVGDWIPVKKAKPVTSADIQYECAQQLGAIG